MTQALSRKIPIRSESDIVEARRLGRELAREIGFGLVDQTRIATGISELTRNVVRYAGEGVLTLAPVSLGDRRGLEITCEDHGPGIPDIERALRGGSGRGGGLGLGIPGTKRLMDEFKIRSLVGIGTTVVVRKWL